MLKLRSNPKSKSAGSSNAHCFGIDTRIACAVGKDSRYSCGAIRALPSANKGEVILQVTDGHQAACLMSSGEMASGRLVPASVLPTRQLNKPVAVRLIDGQWQSTEGKLADDKYGQGEGAFPSIADVLPNVGRRPAYETETQAQKRRSTDDADSSYVVLGIDLNVLRKSAEALGTYKLTLLVPVPVKAANGKAGETFVTKPVAVCPASADEGVNGIALAMPIAPTHGLAYFNKRREVIAEAEKRESQRRSPSSRRAG